MNNVMTTITDWGFSRVSEVDFAKETLAQNKFGQIGLGILKVADFESGTLQTITKICNTVKNIGLGIAVLCFILAAWGIMFGGAMQQQGKKTLIGGIIGIILMVGATSLRDYIQSKATE